MARPNDVLTSKRFILIFASIFLLGAMPLMIGQPSGAATAGLSHGFTLPIERLYHLIALFSLGVYASYLRGNAIILVPLSFVLLYVVGMSLQLDMTRYRMLPFFMLGSVLLFALCMMAAGSHRHGIIGMIISASVGFHFGRYYAAEVPAIASPLYFMIGTILCYGLIFSTAVSFGLTMQSDQPTEPKEGAA